MFTGIVSGVGRIVEVRSLGNGAGFGKALAIETPAGFLDTVRTGDSISVSGACMTVVSLDAGGRRFGVEVSAESLACTAGLDTSGDVNLETALRADARLDGHLVSGHVDGIGRVTQFISTGESWQLRIDAPLALARFLAVKGSVAVDGVSLTVNSVVDRPEACEIGINLIAHTVAHTSLRGLQVGRAVNLEIDLIARYVERMLGSAARSEPERGSR
ncbi:MAG: riboflavin synthase [Pseudomonadota bacterium]|nr:riboflavin synthase [Pseudomonadota bacterium]